MSPSQAKSSRSPEINIDRAPQIPAVIPGGIYTRRQLIHNLRVSPTTLKAWEKAGLLPIPLPGGKAFMFLADDVISFIAKLKPQKRA